MDETRAGLPGADLAAHRADWDGDARVLSCSCGDTTCYIAHIATLLNTDEHGVRQALLAAHDNTEVNAGTCGGCETCGPTAAGTSCRICGDDCQPCLTYYVAAGNGPLDEGQQ